MSASTTSAQVIPRPRNDFDHYHAHVYFDSSSLVQATALVQQASTELAVQVGRIHQKLVGPHPHWSCQLAFDKHSFDEVIRWLEQHRQGLDVLVHGVTGDNLLDHTAHASWLGQPSSLHLDVFH
ncbi:DOPA 4,5-dioxygenase family protein [Pokkaliibacter sp. MBI-7]|uniref:DOPA 4,5-dioxygenase family protein n=1 Tax=Pokkaliibacter sp. MBI-7 TaxID=3040600 RepID=UPI002447396D|nr:DOPA 4,5-dioxygenase family protein [Pokkaliibacter sp. MBI-7]MDH2431896.1 DOPA 4,5-dioxygenase family protein [Pokkaliibacter sp. MBI-7]